MAFIWRHKTSTASSSALRSAYLLLSHWSPAVLISEEVAQPGCNPSRGISSLQQSPIIGGSGPPSEVSSQFMTTSCPQVSRAGHACRPRDNCAEQKALRICASPVGSFLGEEPSLGPEGQNSFTEVVGPCKSGRSPVRTLALPASGTQPPCAAGQVAAGTCSVGVHMRPFGAMRQDNPPSSESCLGPTKRACSGQQQQQQTKSASPDYPGERSANGTKQQHLPSCHSGGHGALGKSAKRRAAEALLAARLGGAVSGGLPFCLLPDRAVTGLDVRGESVSSPLSTIMNLHRADEDIAITTASAGMKYSGCSEAVTSIRYLSSSGAAAGRNACSVDGASPDPDVMAVARDANTSEAVANPATFRLPGTDTSAGVHGGLSVLRQQAVLLSSAAAEERVKAGNAANAKSAVPASKVQQSGLSHAAGVPRPAVQVPGPPTKRARLSLSAAATSSLGAGLSGVAAAAATAVEPVCATTAKTTVPPCDSVRGCKARLQEAVAAARASAKRLRSVDALAVEAGTGSGGLSSGGRGVGLLEAAEEVQTSVEAGPMLLDPVWCSFEVTLPSINWQPVFDEPPGALQRFSLARGYEKLLLPQGLVTYVVENERHIGDALRNLKAGMQDQLVAIDLEWRPETVSGRVSPVAMMQLSSASVCLVVRTCCMGYGLPSGLRSFLEDPKHVLLGFGWDSADETKMRGTFGIGRADFRRFLDLQEVAASLGYQNFGLSRLSQQVLGLPLPKSKSISRSNWAAPQLTNHQLKYASLDVLVAGQLFRALRLWHSSPSPCADCRSPIGELLLPGSLRCGHPTCTRSSASLQQHRDHCVAAGHPQKFDACGTCGRVYELPVPIDITHT